MIKTKESIKGITLIALVLTIVILIILASITVNMAFGENGIVEKAEQAKEMSESSSLKEQMELIKSSQYVENLGKINLDEYWNKLQEEGIIDNKDTSIIDNGDGSYDVVTKPGYVFEVTENGEKDENGNVTDIDIDYIGKGDNLAPRISKINVVEVTENSIKVEVIARNVENAKYTFMYKKIGEADWKEAGTTNDASYIYQNLENGSYDIKVVVTTEKGTGEKQISVTLGIPSGNEDGAIEFGAVSWNNEKAQVLISTNTSYKIEYQINGTEQGKWIVINNNEQITGLNDGDIINARLTDGINHGEYASINIKDNILPNNATIEFSTKTAMAGDTITANVTHVDNESGVNATAGKWIFNTTATNIGTEDSSYTGGISGTFSSSSQTISIATEESNIGTYYLHVLTVDKAGNRTETISSAITLNKITGSISFGAPAWASGSASVTLSTTATSYTIQYRINSGNWTNLTQAPGTTGNTGTNGTVTGLKHNDTLYARLTNGAQYGDETSTKITDTTNPTVVVTVTGKDTSKLTVSVAATDGQSGMTSPVTYTYYIKAHSASSYGAATTNNTTGTYTFDKLTQGTAYDIKVEAQGDVAGNKGTGEITNQSTSTLPGGNTGVEQGAITFGSPTWSGGTASITISSNQSYTIEYQKGTAEAVEENWTTISNGAAVSGINHGETVYARLTDGVNDGEYASITITDGAVPTVTIADSVEGDITHESIKVNVTAIDNETGLATSNTYKYYLNNSLKKTTIEKTYTFTGLTPETSYSIKVEAYDKAGNIGSATKSISTIKKPGIDAGEIASKPLEFYGAEVINYEAPHEGVDKWRIYYADETNIYLIADDYIAMDNTPNGKNGTTVDKNNGSGSKYTITFENMYRDYSGASWISENSKAAKWLSQFLDSYGTSTNQNIRKVAYMMDTNVWSAYYAGEDAEYAMGGPTLEMYCASYKDTHPSKYIECGNLNSNGYNVRWNGGSWSNEVEGITNDYNQIYFKKPAGNTIGIWFASPSAYFDKYLLYTDVFDSSVGPFTAYYNNDFPGLRPIVCLKSDVKLEKQDDGTYQIVH